MIRFSEILSFALRWCKLGMNLLALCGSQLIFAGPAADISSSRVPPCSELYVTVIYKTITVLPTGIDDTQNLQCAIDVGATLGPGVTIRLAEGTFTTAQLVVAGLEGAIRGMGQEATVIHNPKTPMPIDKPDCNNRWKHLFYRLAAVAN